MTLIPNSKRVPDGDASEVVEAIDEMTDDKRFGFAWGILNDIRTTINQTGRVTDQQRHAIANIRASVEPNHGEPRGWKRRYEGHR